jgi:hypothetical protein
MTLGLGLSALLLGAGCSGATSAGEDPLDPSPAKAEPGAQPAQGPDGEAVDPGPITKGSMREHATDEAWLMEAGEKPRTVDLGWAEAKGYTIIDLSDGWVPYIFSNKTPGLDDAGENTYAARYLDLANDRTDSDGDPLSEHEHNFLELYGIPPSLSVIRGEWKDTAGHVQTCLDEAGYDPEVFRRYSGTIAFQKKKGRTRVKKAKWAKGALDTKMKRARIEAGDYAAAATHETTKHYHRNWRALQDQVDVIAHAQKRFRCEKLFGGSTGEGRFVEGDFDSATHHALAAFEKKHNIMGWGHFTPANFEALSQSALGSIHARLQRVIRERIVQAAGILEDGSSADWKPDFRWKDSQGTEHALRDLVGEFSEVAYETLDMQTPETAKESLEELAQLGGGNFESLLVAIKLPEKPEYYADHMELNTVIDRGDVFYDYPFDDEGNRVGQKRKRKPKLTIYATYLDQKIPLVHWQTTIGSWRTETHEGQEWYAYKNSDVGERVWKDIMAGPSWIPPKSTPLKSLVKRKAKGSKWATVVNYDETGPGYRSAYGLVAAYHIKQVTKKDGTVVELDNQIRTHGSVDYMSIMRRFSHGCHRLYNMNAVRLFSFVLKHRDYIRHGQTKIGFARAFELDGKKHRIFLDTRGYNYELTPPIHVEVTEGRVRGRRRKPFEDFMPKPGIEYDENGEEGEETTEDGFPVPIVPMPDPA